jgi:hypothetical protein
MSILTILYLKFKFSFKRIELVDIVCIRFVVYNAIHWIHEKYKETFICVVYISQN